MILLVVGILLIILVVVYVRKRKHSGSGLNDINGQHSLSFNNPIYNELNDNAANELSPQPPLFASHNSVSGTHLAYALGREHPYESLNMAASSINAYDMLPDPSVYVGNNLESPYMELPVGKAFDGDAQHGQGASMGYSSFTPFRSEESASYAMQDDAGYMDIAAVNVGPTTVTRATVEGGVSSEPIQPFEDARDKK